MKTFLIYHLGASVIEMPTEIMGSDGKTTVKEWDAVFKVDDELYLCESKQTMTLQQVNKLPQRIKLFSKYQAKAQEELRKFVGILCGTFFPSDIHDSAHILGFFVTIRLEIGTL